MPPHLIQVLDVGVINDDIEVGSVVGVEDAGEDVDEGGFAGAVVAEN